MDIKRLATGIVLALLFLTSATVSFAQTSTGTILGVVRDASGGAVVGATVTIRNIDNDATRTVTTGEDGAFRVPALLADHYTVTIEKEGFNKQTQTALTLEVAQELVVNATLQVGMSTQEVTVTSEVPVVNTTSGSLGGLVNEEKMADLPLNGRNWADLTLMQPGAAQHRNTGGSSPVTTSGVYYSSNGAPLRSNMYTLDGAIMTGIYGNAANSVNGSTLGVDGIQEFRLTTNNFSAEYALTMGSQATLVSKAGTNTFHGAVFDYLRNSAMDARNVWDTPASSGTTLAGAQRRLPPFKRNNFGGSAGGPIRKDKTFFFATFEGLQERKGVTIVAPTIPGAVTAGQIVNGLTMPFAGNCRSATNNPCASLLPANSIVATAIPQYTVNPLIMPFLNLFPLPTAGLTNSFSFPYTRPVSEQFGELRMDEQISSKDSLFGRYTIDHAALTQATISAPNPNTFDNIHGSSGLMTVSENHIFSPTVLNNARFSISRQQPQDESATPAYNQLISQLSVAGNQLAILGGAPAPICTTGSTCSFIPGYPTFGIGSVAITGAAGFTKSVNIAADQKIYAGSDDVFVTRSKHAIKFGFLLTHWDDNIRYTNGQKGGLTYSSYPNFLNGDNYTSITTVEPFSDTNAAGILRNYRYGTFGLYAQDDIRLTSRLTVNAGLRWEVLLPNIWEQNGLQAALRNVATDQYTTPGPVLRNPGFKNFSPRLGFAWDVMGNGKTSLRGGASLLYDVGDLFPVVIEGARGGGIIGNCNTATSPNCLGANSINISPSTNTQAGACPASVLTMPLTFPACFVSSTLVSADYNTKQPSLGTFSLVLERQLPFGVGLSVGYAGSMGYNLWNRVDNNPCVPVSIVNGAPNWTPANYSALFANYTATGANPKLSTCPNTSLAPNGRVNRYWSSMDMAKTIAHSWYNSLQIMAQKRLSHGLEFQANYVWSKSVDTGNGFLPGDQTWAAFAPNFNNIMKGVSGFDITSRFVVNLLYNLPKTSAKGFVGGVANGWRIGSITSANTGTPFSPSMSADRALSGVKGGGGTNDSDFVTLVPGRSVYSITHGVSTAQTSNPYGPVDPCPTAGQSLGTPNLWYDPCAFTPGPPGSYGVGRSFLRGPGLFEMDFSLTKDTPLKYLGEAGMVEFRLEVFNLLNRANLSMPCQTGGTCIAYSGNTNVVDVEAPIATATSNQTSYLATPTTSRQMQIALRITF